MLAPLFFFDNFSTLLWASLATMCSITTKINFAFFGKTTFTIFYPQFQAIWSNFPSDLDKKKLVKYQSFMTNSGFFEGIKNKNHIVLSMSPCNAKWRFF